MRSALCVLAGLGLLGAASAAPAESPHVNYMLQCQGCHLADGSGAPGTVPPLKGLVGRFLEVPGGREYLVRVPGSSQSNLDDAELAAVLNWIVAQFGPPPAEGTFERFTAEEVAAVRRPPLDDVAELRASLLAAMEPAGPVEP